MTLSKKLFLIPFFAVYVLSMAGKWFWSVPGVIETSGMDSFNLALCRALACCLFWVGVWAFGSRKRLYLILRFSMLAVLTTIDLSRFLTAPAVLNEVPVGLAVSFNHTYPMFYLHVAALAGMWAVSIWGQRSAKDIDKTK